MTSERAPRPDDGGPFPAWVPRWARGLCGGSLTALALYGLTWLLALAMAADEELRNGFALVAAGVGFYVGLCLLSPRPVGLVLAWPVVVVVIVGWGYFRYVETGQLSRPPDASIRGEWVRYLGVLWVVAFGAAAVALPLWFRLSKPLRLALAGISLLIVLVLLGLAVASLWQRYA